LHESKLYNNATKTTVNRNLMKYVCWCFVKLVIGGFLLGS